MGKNKSDYVKSDPLKLNTQELEDTKRISKGFDKKNSTKSK